MKTLLGLAPDKDFLKKCCRKIEDSGRRCLCSCCVDNSSAFDQNRDSHGHALLRTSFSEVPVQNRVLSFDHEERILVEQIFSRVGLTSSLPKPLLLPRIFGNSIAVRRVLPLTLAWSCPPVASSGENSHAIGGKTTTSVGSENAMLKHITTSSTRV